MVNLTGGIQTLRKKTKLREKRFFYTELFLELIKAVIDEKHILREIPEHFRGDFDSIMGGLSQNNLQFLVKIFV